MALGLLIINDMMHDHFEEVWWTSDPGLPTPHIPNNWPQSLHGNLIQSRRVVLPLQVFSTFILYTLKIISQLIGKSHTCVPPHKDFVAPRGLKSTKKSKTRSKLQTHRSYRKNKSFSSTFTIIHSLGFHSQKGTLNGLLRRVWGSMTYFPETKEETSLKRKLMWDHNLTGNWFLQSPPKSRSSS